jgi:hypothetical protein
MRRVAFECDNAAGRFAAWHKVFHQPKTKVVKLQQIEGQR